MTDKNALIIVIIVAVFTFLTRLLPFLLFRGKNIPKPVKYLGGVLPPAIMALLVIYCLKSVNISAYPFGLPELISVLFVAGVHILKRNNLLSIGLGTVFYMILIQAVFV